MHVQMEARRYFSFMRLYWEVCASLSTDSKKVRFLSAVTEYGLEQSAPDFGDDSELQLAWRKVLPDLVFSWEQRTMGGHGGNVTAAKKNEGTRQNKTDEKAKNQNTEEPLPLFPDGGEPTPAFLDYLRRVGLDALADAPKPLTGAQMRWLHDVFGDIAAASVARWCDNFIKEHGGGKFWELTSMADTTTGDFVFETITRARDAFDLWHRNTFPRLARHAYPLTLGEYQELREKYGRANVLVKLNQLEASKMIYANTKIARIVEKFIISSINRRSDSAYWLPPRDDAPGADINGCAPGYDAGFDFMPYPALPKK